MAKLMRVPRGTFEPEIYGLVGDGSAASATADTLAIQTAIDLAEDYVAATNSAAIVTLPPGRFRINQPIRVKEHAVHIFGAGGAGDWWTPFGTALVPTADFPADEYVLDYDHSAKTTSLYGNRLKGVAIISEEDEFDFDNVFHGLRWGVAKGWAEDVYIQGMPGHGMGVDGFSSEFKVYDARFLGCNFRKNGTNGIEFISSNSDLWFSLCKSEGNVSGAGLYGLGANCYYDNCHFTGNLNNVTNKTGTTESIFVGCNFEGPSQHNVKLDTTDGLISRARFVGCHFNSNRLDADNTWDSVYIGRDSGSATCNALFVGNTFSATETNKPRHHINLSDAAAFQVDVQSNTWGATSFGTSGINHNSAAVRCVVNGLGHNAGNPTTTGDWNGFGEEGVRVRDTSGGAFYTYLGGAWVAE